MTLQIYWHDPILCSIWSWVVLYVNSCFAPCFVVFMFIFIVHKSISILLVWCCPLLEDSLRGSLFCSLVFSCLVHKNMLNNPEYVLYFQFFKFLSIPFALMTSLNTLGILSISLMRLSPGMVFQLSQFSTFPEVRTFPSISSPTHLKHLNWIWIGVCGGQVI